MSKERKIHGYLRDEQGDKSLSRLALVVTLGFTLLIMALDVAAVVVVDAIVYESLVAVILAEATWAGAPRAMRYVRARQAPPEELP